MKKNTGMVITVAISLVLLISGAVLQGVTLTSGNFNIVPLATTMRDVGLIAGLLSGLALVAVLIVGAIRGTEK
ncbi:MAG: hypothetical protein FWD89_01255 [Firmicutes bacterium]|nr:hypothetical protein [Bacillota bacterium]MCL2770919.1 hypothetical protein [Bacillota bacterium]